MRPSLKKAVQIAHWVEINRNSGIVEAKDEAAELVLLNWQAYVRVV